MTKLVLKETIPAEQGGHAADYLAARTGLSKARIKEALAKGAVWLKSGKGSLRRIRKATSPVRAGEHIELHYDPELLTLIPPQAQLLRDEKHYSVWLKPAGLMAQGTMFGDHCSLLRQVEQHFACRRQVFPVHRLDREASGLMIVGHTKEGAARLSALFSDNRVVKRYRIEVLGDVARKGKEGVIRLSLDGKSALTKYTVLSYDQGKNVSVVDVVIETGRLHQIRRHFDMIGHPVMGDPKYGTGNKNRSGMRLTAYGLSFVCPFSNKTIEIEANSKFEIQGAK